jgi:hypothetical protein
MQDTHLSIEKEETNGVWHLIVNAQRVGTFPILEAYKRAAREATRAWLQSLGVDPKTTKIEEYIPRHPIPETNLHRTIIKLQKPRD